MKYQTIRTLLTGCAIFCFASLADAAPAVNWHQSQVDLSFSNCVKHAPLAIRGEYAVEKLKRNKVGATAWTRRTAIVVQCVGIGSNRSQVIIVVAGERSTHITGVGNQIMSALKSGRF